MSILVKGMQMPTTCRYCEFERIGHFGGEWCALTKTDIPRKPIKRLKDCPLVEVVMPNIVHWLNDIEIVRCKDCKYWSERYASTGYKVCLKGFGVEGRHFATPPNGYCYCGERKDEVEE